MTRVIKTNAVSVPTQSCRCTTGELHCTAVDTSGFAKLETGSEDDAFNNFLVIEEAA